MEALLLLGKEILVDNSLAIAVLVVLFVIERAFLRSKKSGFPGRKKKKSDPAGIEKLLASFANVTQSYHSFTVPKRDGTSRTIDAPSDELKAAQRKLLAWLETNYGFSEHVTGFRRGKSLWDNAKPHSGKKAVVNVDVEDFFPSVTETKVSKALVAIGIPETSIPEFLRLTTYRGCLPQGAPTSPFIANLVFAPVDDAVVKLLKKYDKKAKYTRYADDLTFSSNDSKIVNAIRIIEDGILPRFGFRAKKKKTCVYRAHTRQTVTGLVVNGKKPRISRERYMKIRSLAWKELCGQGIVPLATLKGHLAAFLDLDRDGYSKLKKSFEKKIDRTKLDALFPKKKKHPVP